MEIRVSDAVYSLLIIRMSSLAFLKLTIKFNCDYKLVLTAQKLLIMGSERTERVS